MSFANVFSDLDLLIFAVVMSNTYTEQFIVIQKSIEIQFSFQEANKYYIIQLYF